MFVDQQDFFYMPDKDRTACSAYQNFCQICYTELLQANASQLLRTSIEMYGTYTTLYIILTNQCIDSVRLDLTCHKLQLVRHVTQHHTAIAEHLGLWHYMFLCQRADPL